LPGLPPTLAGGALRADKYPARGPDRPGPARGGRLGKKTHWLKPKSRFRSSRQKSGRAQEPPQADGLALAAGAWRVGWSGPGRAAGVALAVAWGVAADRTGPDRVGSRAAVGGRGAGGFGSGTGAHRPGGRWRPEEARHDRLTASDRVSGLFGSHRTESRGDVDCKGFGPILIVVVRSGSGADGSPGGAAGASPLPDAARQQHTRRQRTGVGPRRLSVG